MKMILKSLLTQAHSKSEELSESESEGVLTSKVSTVLKNTENWSGYNSQKTVHNFNRVPKLLLLSAMIAVSGSAWATYGGDSHDSNGSGNGQGHEVHGNGNGYGHGNHDDDDDDHGHQGPIGPIGPQGIPGKDGLNGTNGVDGKDGEKGDKGEQGIAGVNGATGATGEKGDKGDQGVAGVNGTNGEKGDKGDQGVAGVNGTNGEKGDKGDTGAKGDKGYKGDTGTTGLQGDMGLSAYDVAVDNGFKGTEGEWLLSLRGPTGRDGENTLAEAKSYTDSRVDELNRRVDHLEDGLYAAVASSIAIASLPQPTDAGYNMFSVGMGTWESEQGFAIGFSGVSENNKYVYKLAATETVLNFV